MFLSSCHMIILKSRDRPMAKRFPLPSPTEDNTEDRLERLEPNNFSYPGSPPSPGNASLRSWRFLWVAYQKAGHVTRLRRDCRCSLPISPAAPPLVLAWLSRPRKPPATQATETLVAVLTMVIVKPLVVGLPSWICVVKIF